MINRRDSLASFAYFHVWDKHEGLQGKGGVASDVIDGQESLKLSHSECFL